MINSDAQCTAFFLMSDRKYESVNAGCHIKIITKVFILTYGQCANENRLV